MKGRPGLALAAALLTLAPLTAACGAGLGAETLNERTTIDGANAQTGVLRIRDGYLLAPPGGIEYPAGSTIPIRLTLVNIGSQPDTLVEATSPLGQVAVQPASSSGSASAAGTAGVVIPAGESVSIGGTGGQMSLRQISRSVRIAAFVPITLRFAQSDQVTIMAPVGTGYGPGASSSGQPSDSAVPFPVATPTGTGKSSPSAVPTTSVVPTP